MKLEFRWKHLNKHNEYKLKRAVHGGGVKGMSVPKTADAKGCIQIAQNGKLEDVSLKSAN